MHGIVNGMRLLRSRLEIRVDRKIQLTDASRNKKRSSCRQNAFETRDVIWVSTWIKGVVSEECFPIVATELWIGLYSAGIRVPIIDNLEYDQDPPPKSSSLPSFSFLSLLVHVRLHQVSLINHHQAIFRLEISWFAAWTKTRRNLGSPFNAPDLFDLIVMVDMSKRPSYIALPPRLSYGALSQCVTPYDDHYHADT